MNDLFGAATQRGRKHVHHGAAPRPPEIYVQAVNGVPIGPKNGSCGTAMYRGQPVIVTDMLTDPLWEDYRELAKLSGLRACWSTPIFTGQGKVLGSFATYYTSIAKASWVNCSAILGTPGHPGRLRATTQRNNG